jgi:hypothetical protein
VALAGAVVAFQVAKTKMLYAKWQNWRKVLEDKGRQVAEKGAQMTQPVTMRIFSDYV